VKNNRHTPEQIIRTLRECYEDAIEPKRMYIWGPSGQGTGD
jgi:hypothetical protein